MSIQMEYNIVGEVRNEGRKGTAGLVESAEVARVAALTADDKKAKDIRLLDIRSISTITDYFVLCTGTNTTHVRAIADHIEEQVTALGMQLHHMEGYQNGRWILLDFGDIVIHVMHEEERQFYNLDRLWGDALELSMPRSEVG